MCGIFGIIGKDYETNHSQFIEGLKTRGPDDSGLWISKEDKVSLGHTRLSIIDLSNSGKQPMSDGDNIIFFNGEIYNYKEIKDELLRNNISFNSFSDTEVILKSYECWGLDCLKKFRGMFAFAIYNKQKKEIVLARDRFGIKPLIYKKEGDNFIFSSETGPLLKKYKNNLSVNKNALFDYLKYGSVKQPDTFFNDVYQLMPGHFMIIDKNLNTINKPYYNILEKYKNHKTDLSYEDSVNQIRQTLEEATKYHLIADVDVGAFLSGGIDSTAVVALMNQYSKKPISTFSVGFDTKKEVVDELSVAKINAKRIGTNHHEVIV